MAKKRIVIAEDEAAYANILRDALKKKGYEVSVVKNGEELLKNIKKNDTALILLDLLMPVIDGFEALEEIKKNSEFAHIKVIALSNLSQGADIEKAKKLGADEFIVKSDETLEHVVHAIDTMCQKSAVR